MIQDAGMLGIAIKAMSSVRTACAESIGGSDDLACIFFEKNAQRSAAHFTVVIHIAWNFIQ